MDVNCVFSMFSAAPRGVLGCFRGDATLDDAMLRRAKLSRADLRGAGMPQGARRAAGGGLTGFTDQIYGPIYGRLVKMNGILMIFKSSKGFS